jgi:cysteinyl-tRNA synthetase
MHSGLLKINGEKMSKSLGNFAMLKDLFTSYHPEVIRYYLISSHYRSSLNFDDESLDQARAALTRLYQAASLVSLQESDFHEDSVREFINSMNDDLNTPEALSTLFGLAKLINSSQDKQEQIRYASTMRELGKVLGLFNDSPEAFLQYGANLTDEEIGKKIEERNQARDNKDFQKADQIRDELSAQGILLDDSNDGTTWKKS